MISTGPRRFEVVETREAWLVTPANLESIAEWCGGEAYDDPAVAHVQYPVDPDTDRHGHFAGCAYVGDVLVRDGERFYDVPEWLFERDLAPKWREVQAS